MGKLRQILILWQNSVCNGLKFRPGSKLFGHHAFEGFFNIFLLIRTYVSRAPQYKLYCSAWLMYVWVKMIQTEYTDTHICQNCELLFIFLLILVMGLPKGCRAILILIFFLKIVKKVKRFVILKKIFFTCFVDWLWGLCCAKPKQNFCILLLLLLLLLYTYNSTTAETL